MSVFNGEADVNTSIKSILNQTIKDFEFMIIDDGSTDKSLKIIKDYAKKDNRIKIIKNSKNIGLTKSLNRGIKLSKGKYIARQDVDDVSLPERLEIQINFLQENPKYAFCGCNGFSKQNKMEELTNFFEFDEIKKILIVQNCFSHPSVVLRREVFKKYGFYDNNYRFGQDYELWCRLIYKYHLKGKNLKDKLIMMDVPFNRFLKKNAKKYLIQRINAIRTQFKYITYSQYKFKCIISIFIRLIEIFTFSKIMRHFISFIKKINF